MFGSCPHISGSCPGASGRCLKLQHSVSGYTTYPRRLYKPFARKPWLTVYRASVGMACRDGLSWHKLSSQVICFRRGSNFVQRRPVEKREENITYLPPAMFLTIRFWFPAVQTEIKHYWFTFSKRGVQENLFSMSFGYIKVSMNGREKSKFYR